MEKDLKEIIDRLEKLEKGSQQEPEDKNILSDLHKKIDSLIEKNDSHLKKDLKEDEITNPKNENEKLSEKEMKETIQKWMK